MKCEKDQNGVMACVTVCKEWRITNFCHSCRFNPRRFFILDSERKRKFHLHLRPPHIFQPSYCFLETKVDELV